MMKNLMMEAMNPMMNKTKMLKKKLKNQKENCMKITLKKRKKNFTKSQKQLKNPMKMRSLLQLKNTKKSNKNNSKKTLKNMNHQLKTWFSLRIIPKENICKISKKFLQIYHKLNNSTETALKTLKIPYSLKNPLNSALEKTWSKLLLT